MSSMDYPVFAIADFVVDAAGQGASLASIARLTTGVKAVVHF
jgi:hypothetical protein